jgi:hypothetical protein
MKLEHHHCRPRLASAAVAGAHVRRKHMPRYRVIIHGRNFRLKVEGKWEKMGFYAPRFTDAADPLMAEHTALEDFRQSAKYRALMDGTLNADDDPPTLCGEDIEEVAAGAGAGQLPAGLALYKESDNRGTEPDASLKGVRATPAGNSGSTEGPPSVS